MNGIVVRTDNAERQIVRCGLNSYKTPLFSFDAKGIYVRCKDCRSLGADGEIRRGTFHLYPWSIIFQMAFGLVVGEELLDGDRHIETGRSTGGDNPVHEEPAGIGIPSPTGDSGG